MDNNEFNPFRYRTRWFCYIDLLGFKRLVYDQKIKLVIPQYKKALSEIENAAIGMKAQGIYHSWFSDTFIIYSHGDKENDFNNVEIVSRGFFQNLILRKIPFRGALTYGGLYSQLSTNIFVGPALIDAYCYAEHQDWVGFIITPAAQTQLKNLSISLGSLHNYRQVDLSKITKSKSKLSGSVYAFTFDNGKLNGENPYLAKLESMMATAPPLAKPKYEKTIEFIKKD